MPIPAASWLSADIGGTHARIARVGLRDGRIVVLRHQRVPVAGSRSLAALLGELAQDGDVAAIAVAGQVHGDAVLSDNLPWPVDAHAIAHAARLRHVALVNDFEAAAHGIPQLPDSALHHLCGPQHAQAGPVLLLGPGTGLGAAVRLPDGRVLPSEAGHAALAPGTPRELALLGWLMQQRDHVDNDRVLSGPGLLNVYRGLCALDGVTARHATPEQVVEAAQAAEPQAQEAAQLVCDVLGSLAGDLAACFDAAAVYVTGGVSWHLRHWLHGGGFARRFVRKGVLSPRLQHVPVWRVASLHFGVLGAAAWYRQHHGQWLDGVRTGAW